MLLPLNFKILLISIAFIGVASGYGINYTAFCGLENISSLLDINPLFSQIRTTIPLNFRKPSNVSQLKDGTIEWFYGHVRLLDRKGKMIYTLDPDHRYDLGLARRHLSVSFYLELRSSLVESLNEICLSNGTDLYYGSYVRSQDELCLRYKEQSTLYNISRLKKVIFKQDKNELLLFEEYENFIMKRSISPYKNMFLTKVITFPPRNQSIELRVHMTQCREKVLNTNEEVSLLYNKELFIHAEDICEFVNFRGNYKLRTTHSSYLENVPLFPRVLNGSHTKIIDITIKAHFNQTCGPTEEVVDLFAYPEHLMISNIGYWQNFTLEMQSPFNVESVQYGLEKCILYLISSVSGEMTRMVVNITETFKISQYPVGFIIYPESTLEEESFFPEMCLTRLRCLKRFLSSDCLLKTSPILNLKLWKKIMC